MPHAMKEHLFKEDIGLFRRIDVPLNGGLLYGGTCLDGPLWGLDKREDYRISGWSAVTRSQ